MNSRDYLPFPRGQTASQFDTKIPGPGGLVSLLPTATGTVTGATPYRKDLAGFIGNCLDTKTGIVIGTHTATTAGVFGTPGTNQSMRLRAVQAAAAITTTMVGQLMAFVTTAGEYGSVVTATTAQGTPCKPIDGFYPVGTVFAAYDWFWVVEEGPAFVVPANGITLAAQGPVTSYTTDGTAGVAAAADFVVGTSDQQVTGAITSTTHAVMALVWVKAGVDMVEA